MAALEAREWDLYDAVQRMDLEGIVAKRKTDLYDPRTTVPARLRVRYALEYVSTIDHQVQHLTTTRPRREGKAAADAVRCAF